MTLSPAENEAALPEKDSDEKALIEKPKQPKNMDDFFFLGRYCFLFMVGIELMTLTSVISKVSMVYMGATPNVISCGNVTFLTQKDACDQLPLLIETTDCKPELEYQFLSVNVEYNLICDDVKLVKNSISVQMFGVLVGAFFFGQLSDSYGRKMTLLISLLSIAGTCFVNAYVYTFAQFYWIRVISGFFTGGLSATMGVYMIENVPKKHRMWLTTVVSWSPNYIVFPIVAYFCYDWRSLLIANAAIALLSALIVCALPESPRFLVQKGRVERARQVFSMIRRIDGKAKEHRYEQEDLEEMLKHEQTIFENRAKKQRKYTYYHIICTWEMLTWTTTLAFGVGATSLTNYGLMFNMEKLSGSLYWNNVWLGIIRWAMNIVVALGDFYWDRFGRKPINTLALVFNGACLSWICWIYYQNAYGDGGWVLRTCTIGITAMCSQLYLAKFMAGNELYPTAVRNLAASNLSIWSRFGTMVAPQLFQLSDFSQSLPYVILLIITIIDLVTFEVFIPETKGQSLENNLPPKERRLFYREKARRQSLISDM